jgi:hypothetical protein
MPSRRIPSSYRGGRPAWRSFHAATGPGVTNEEFEADAAVVAADLETLRDLIEG